MIRFRPAALVLAVLVWAASLGHAADRSNIPLRNWGGGSVYRDWVYDDLERLVTAGLADRVLLSTKPLSRVEGARVVGRAIEKVRGDASGVYSLRRDLEPVLDRLIEEFRAELRALGVRLPGDAPSAPGWISVVPADRVQVRAGYASRDLSWVNSQGLRFQSGANGGATLESRAQIGDVLSLYVQPEFQANEELAAVRLATGYAKLTLFNVELLVGRDSLWWGPALHGSLIMSNNAPPLDQVRIGAAEPFLLPWIGEWVGPTKLLLFLAELEERRDFKRAKLGGMRGTIAPFSFLELGASYANMFDGDQRPRLKARDYPRVLFSPTASDQDLSDRRFRNNILFALDADVRLRDVHRFFVPARDLRIYGEFGWDDTCCETSYIPDKHAISGLVGIQLLGLFGVGALEARFEYAETSTLSFTHNQFYRGYWTRGEVISHFVGTEGNDYFARVTNRLTPNLMLGLELNRAVIGSTVFQAAVPKERRVSGGIDLSWRFWEKYSLFGAYQLMDATNRNFRRGDDGVDHLLRIELTRSFR